LISASYTTMGFIEFSLLFLECGAPSSTRFTTLTVERRPLHSHPLASPALSSSSSHRVTMIHHNTDPGRSVNSHTSPAYLPSIPPHPTSPADVPSMRRIRLLSFAPPPLRFTFTDGTNCTKPF
jgi:hypothetical protein